MNNLNTPFHARQPHCHETVATPTNPATSGMVLYPMDVVWLIFVFWAVVIRLIIYFNMQQEEK